MPKKCLGYVAVPEGRLVGEEEAAGLERSEAIAIHRSFPTCSAERLQQGSH
jgi:hypothetical protein